MASGQDKDDRGKSEDSEPDSGIVELPELSPRALAIKRRIEAGTYQVNHAALADRLLGEVDEQESSLPNLPIPQNDQEPRDS
ncbi:MAG: flagellar biosynthesis anti-sigma factor FlgM [Myxococcales bacterium]|nr:flagellar biosynthesis anti-sigma factor FlgM [Myxococcales bacterium]